MGGATLFLELVCLYRSHVLNYRRNVWNPARQSHLHRCREYNFTTV